MNVLHKIATDFNHYHVEQICDGMINISSGVPEKFVVVVILDNGAYMVLFRKKYGYINNIFCNYDDMKEAVLDYMGQYLLKHTA